MALTCVVCGKRAYSQWCMQHKPRKQPKRTALKPSQGRLKPKGKKTLEYEKWRDTVARPYLDEKYGLQCSKCGVMPPLKGGIDQTEFMRHDVDHIKPRGSHYHLKMNLDNVRYLCRKCHTERSQSML